MKIGQSSSAILTLFQGCAVCVADPQISVLDLLLFLKKSHFLVCFAMPATLIAHILPQSLRLMVDVTLQQLCILSACGSLNRRFTK